MAAAPGQASDSAVRLAVSTSIEPRFAVGQKFMTAGKHPREMTVTDILRTYNLAGNLVRLRYVAQHEFMGQTITDYDVIETSIARRATAPVAHGTETSAVEASKPI